jgi:hypothetical protein
MDTNPEPFKDILNELFSLLESLETQSLALTQFLKDQGIATDEKLAPYLDRAGNASSVKWRAARARMQYLLSPVPKQSSDKEKEKESEKSGKPEKPEKPEKPPEEKSSTEKPAKQELPTDEQKPDSSGGTKDAAPNANAKAGKNSDSGAKDNEKKSDTRKESKRD